jgi:hypothetical protein
MMIKTINKREENDCIICIKSLKDEELRPLFNTSVEGIVKICHSCYSTWEKHNKNTIERKSKREKNRRKKQNKEKFIYDELLEWIQENRFRTSNFSSSVDVGSLEEKIEELFND